MYSPNAIYYINQLAIGRFSLTDLIILNILNAYGMEKKTRNNYGYRAFSFRYQPSLFLLSILFEQLFVQMLLTIKGKRSTTITVVAATTTTTTTNDNIEKLKLILNYKYWFHCNISFRLFNCLNNQIGVKKCWK